jgi:transposase
LSLDVSFKNAPVHRRRPGQFAGHKSAAAEQAVRAMGAWLLFLPPYSPDLNPIEMAFAKLKALLRARAVRTIDALWRAIGEICDLFSPQECQNYFHAAGNALT